MNLELRPHQAEALQGMKRWNVIIFHRRAGKTIMCLIQLIIACLTPTREAMRFYYIAPTFGAAKAIAWDILIGFIRDLPGIKFNVSELRADFPNGSRIQLLGVERVDTLRGRYSDGIVLDEAAVMPSSAWGMVLRPMLADRIGWAIITGTPMGSNNLLGNLYDQGRQDEEWFTLVRNVTETDALDPREVEALRRQLSPQAFQQEMMCSFTAALMGAFYASQMELADVENRLTKITVDPRFPVYVALDLGFSDATACWFFQKVGNNIHLLKMVEYKQMSLPEIVAEWRKFPFKVSGCLLPHDARVHDLGTGKTRLEVMRSLGLICYIVKKITVHDGIEAVRNILPRCWFDYEGCQLGIEAMRAYRSSVDQVKQVAGTKPLHDWSSHSADGFRYLAVGIDLLGDEWDLFEGQQEAVTW